jgi:toxin-antitoxin system PIN domain toxin
VILPDANLLIYSTNRDSPEYRAAKRWLDASLAGGHGILLGWVVILAFLRITTNKRIFDRPLSIESAWSVVQGWLGHPLVSIAHPGPEHARILQQLLVAARATGDLITDAHLAALAIEHDAEVCSVDRDFARFPNLRWRNPLEQRLP